MIQLSPDAPSWWLERCRSESNLFDTPAWAGVLRKGFNCSIHYALDDEKHTGLMIPTFNAGPFRIGYAGFPTSDTLDPATGTSIIQALKTSRGSDLPHILRYTPSAFAQCEWTGRKIAELPESAITNLQDWQESALSGSIKRNLRKAIRSDLRVEAACNESHSKLIHEMYLDTVSRNNGTARYSASYFREVVSLSRTHPDRLRCLMACAGPRIAGFIITVAHKNTSYYLHGAYKPELSSLRPSDFLFLEAIKHAKLAGSDIFNFLASPANQASLVKYKEKWGATTRYQKSYSFTISALFAHAFTAAEKVMGMLPNSIRSRTSGIVLKNSRQPDN